MKNDDCFATETFTGPFVRCLHTCMYQIDIFYTSATNSLPAAGLFSCSRPRVRAGGPRVHHGASVAPGRAPCRVLWAFKVSKSGRHKESGGFRNVSMTSLQRRIARHLNSTCSRGSQRGKPSEDVCHLITRVIRYCAALL